MYTYETFYDHYVILKDNKILYHIDAEAEAKKEIELLDNNKEDKNSITQQQNSLNYITYHLHTEQSLLDSCTNYKLYVDRAKELGQRAICFTEHGNLYSWLEKKMYCDEQGIKYLHGVECYLTKTLEEKIRDNYHTILIAKNMEGFKELNNLVFKSTWQDHKYYKPRLSFDEFLGISDNIIKISACLASPLNKFRKEYQGLTTSSFHKLLLHYDYYEIQYHNNIEQIEFNQWLYDMSKRFNKPLIVGTDTHSINSYKAECRKILQWGKTDGVWGDGENEFDLTYKSYDELIELFKQQNSLPMDVVLEALNNTNIMADGCDDIVIDTSVKYPICYGEKDEEVMWDNLRKNYMYKKDNDIIDDNPKYIDNIKEEMRVFKKTNMVGFMLFMSEMLTWCRDNNIPTCPCRGSVGGSTAAYISNIIDVDPVKWNTIFSRFCNEDRLEVGDIDVDFYEEDRPKVYNYIINRFGKEKTAYILASGTAVDKGTIDIIGKAFHNQWKDKMGYSKNDKSHDKESPYRLSIVAQIKKEYAQNPTKAKEDYKELFYYFDGLLNTVVSQSQHPAGMVASPINLIDNYSMFMGENGQEILPINMDEVHEVGLVKYDILGLKNIGIIKKCCEYSHIPYPKAHEIDWNDQEVYKDMITNPIGIFQFEGDYAFSLLKKFGVKSVDDMSLVNASLRPSGASYRDRLIAHESNKNPSELIDKLLEPNHGYLIYQEDTIKFLQEICGLSGSDADNVRRAIGRKQMDRLQKALPQILEGYCNMSDKPREIAEREAKQFLQIIEDSSNYQFGYNHSTGYSMIGYLCAHMRCYHLKEFICAFLNCSELEEDIYNGTMLAKEKGIKIVSPRFRKSLSDYMCDPNSNTIYKGIASIKDIGKNNGDELFSLKDNTYPTFIDLLYDIKEKTTVNSKQLDILTKLNFFSEFGEIYSLLSQIVIFDKYYKSKTIKKEKLTDQELECVQGCYEKETPKQFSGINNAQFINNLIKANPSRPTTIYDKIKWQSNLLGYIDEIIPSASPSNCVVEKVEVNKFGTPFITLYQLCSGESKTIKADKKQFGKFKLIQNDIIECLFGTKQKYKKTGVDNNGKPTFSKLNEYEKILKNWALVEE